MSRRKLVTESGERVLLPGQKNKLCDCGQPATRYCDFPKYQLNPLNHITCGTPHLVCAEPLCDRCAVEQPNEKDFCRRHSDQVEELIKSANEFEPIELGNKSSDEE